MRELVYGARIGSSEVLGPGKRAILWVYGCPRQCPGCIAESFRKGKPRTASTEEMAEWYLAQNADGLTVSGGEPMQQAAALAEMIGSIRRRRDTGVIVYTGYLYEELLRLAERDAAIRDFLAVIDLLIDGPYIEELDRNQPYIGSSNQRLIPLTERYAGEMGYYSAAEGRRVEIHVSEKQTLLVGVPGQDQKRIWERIKNYHET